MDDVTKMRLIELYRSHRCIWDKEDGNYHNRIVRENSWQEISDMLGIPARSLVKQMGCLLSSFRREERKVRDMTLKGKLYTPQWKFYNMFLFRSTIDEDGDGDGDGDVDDTDNFDNSTGDIPFSAIIPKIETKLEEMENTSIDECGQTYGEEYLNVSSATTTTMNGLNSQYGKRAASDEFSAMGIMVEAKLRKMNSKQRLFAENIINQALYKGLMFQLSDDSQILTTTNISSTAPTQTEKEAKLINPSKTNVKKGNKRSSSREEDEPVI